MCKSCRGKEGSDGVVAFGVLVHILRHDLIKGSDVLLGELVERWWESIGHLNGMRFRWNMYIQNSAIIQFWRDRVRARQRGTEETYLARQSEELVSMLCLARYKYGADEDQALRFDVPSVVLD